MPTEKETEIEQNKNLLFIENKYSIDSWDNDIRGIAFSHIEARDKNETAESRKKIDYEKDTNLLNAYIADYRIERRKKEDEYLGINALSPEADYNRLYSVARNNIKTYYRSNGIDYTNEPDTFEYISERIALSNRANSVIEKATNEAIISTPAAILQTMSESNAHLPETISYMINNGYKESFDKAIDEFKVNNFVENEDMSQILMTAEKDFVKKIYSNKDDFLYELKSVNTIEDLVSKWDKIRKEASPYCYYCKGNTLSGFDGNAFEMIGLPDEEQYNAINTLEEITALFNIYDSRIHLLGSEYGKILPTDNLEFIPEDDRTQIIKNVIKDERIANEIDFEYYKMDRNKATIFEIDIKKHFDIDKFAFCDQNGELSDVSKGYVDLYNECIKNGNPIYAINKENGSVQPIISNGKDGNILAGNDEIANAHLKDVAITAKPGLFARMFDSILRTFGLDKYRSRECIEYRKAIEQNRVTLERNKIITAAQNKVNSEGIVSSQVHETAKTITASYASAELNKSSVGVEEDDEMVIAGDISAEEDYQNIFDFPEEPIINNYQPSEEAEKILKALQSSKKYSQVSKDITAEDIDMILGKQKMQKETFNKFKKFGSDIKNANDIINKFAELLENKNTVKKDINNPSI